LYANNVESLLCAYAEYPSYYIMTKEKIDFVIFAVDFFSKQ